MDSSMGNRAHYGADRAALSPPIPALEACADVYDFLDHLVRPRPGMWARGGSLQELAIMLHGYGVALHLHAVDEAKQFALSANGPFSRWLASRYGWAMALGWASAIEQHSRENETAIEAFFRVLDEYRAATQHPGPR